MRSGSGFGNASGLLLRSDSSAEQADRPAHNGTYGRLITVSETEHNAGYGRTSNVFVMHGVWFGGRFEFWFF